METKESITSETIAGVISDMRKGVLDWKGERIGVFDHFADRIEAAAKRLLRRNEMLKIRLKCIEEEYLKTKRENNRLRAALKPVLNVNIDAAIEHGVDCTELFGAIIKDAQKTYREGEAK